MSDFSIKKDSTAPALVTQCKRDGAGVNLATATTITLRLRHKARDLGLSKAMTVATASTGHVQYEWATGDTDVIGDYDLDVKVVWSDGDVEYFPSGGNRLLSIVA